MSIPLTQAPVCAAGMARLPVPHATSSTDSPGRSASRAMNSSAPGAKLRAMGRKSPEVQTDLALAVRGSSDQARITPLVPEPAQGGVSDDMPTPRSMGQGAL